MDQRAYHQSIRAVAKHGGRFDAMMKLMMKSFLFLLLLISIDASSSDPRQRKAQDIKDPFLSLPDNDGVSSAGGPSGNKTSDLANDFPGPDDLPLEVVGGTNAEFGEYPTYVFLDSGCGGNLISPNYVLSAAHCFCNLFYGANSVDLCNEPERKSLFSTVYVGANYFFNETPVTGYKRFCTKTIISPKFSWPQATGDIALCKLSEPVWSIEPMTIDTEFLGNDVDVQIIGFGSTTFDPNPPHLGNSPPPPVLQKAKSTTEDCANWKVDNVTRDYGEDYKNIICLRNQADSGISACQGDSGGPLIIEKGGKKVQVGVFSFTHPYWGCKGSDETPTQGYARVSLERGDYEFIQKTVCKDDPSESASLCASPTPVPTTAPMMAPTSAPTTAPTLELTPAPTSEPTCTCKKISKNKRF